METSTQGSPNGASGDNAAGAGGRLGVVLTGARSGTAMVSATIGTEESHSVAEGETVRMTSELPSITAVPAASGAPGSVSRRTGPRSAPKLNCSRSTMIGVGSPTSASLTGTGSLSWIDPPGGAAPLSTGRQMLPSTGSAFDSTARTKTATTKRSRSRHPGCFIPMVLIFPPLILRLRPDPEPLFPGPCDRPAGGVFRDHLPEERLAGNNPRSECRRQGDVRVPGLGAPQLGVIDFHHLDRIRRRVGPRLPAQLVGRHVQVSGRRQGRDPG